ncbi:unnamed protein product [Hermetia illucens]|uniref:G-protein coupled receptors family 1 profile domain-containing protein n=1 Tax=Hermetia illucens TaxID=343691 RepID=A0A7R8UK31_HERIL|nr:unnamed protein product [Hermetia illucens]
MVRTQFNQNSIEVFIFRVAKGPFIEDFYQCVTHGFYTAEWQEQLYTTFTLFFTFIIPLCILIVTYLSTFRTISGSEKMFQNSKHAAYNNRAQLTNRQRLIHKAKMKSLRISVVIVVAFLICWTPYNVMMIIFTFLNPDKRLGEDLQSGIFFFGMSNSLVNPLIYGAFHLWPIKQHGQYTHYSLTRDGSNTYQRSPSMTATTQLDTNGSRHTFKRSSHYQRCSFRNDHFNLVTAPRHCNSMRKEFKKQTSLTNGTNSHLVLNYAGIIAQNNSKLNVSSV